MRILDFKTFEAKLDLPLLKRPSLHGDGLRGDTLISKVREGDPLIVNTEVGKKDVVVNRMLAPDQVNYLSPARAIPNIVDRDGDYDPNRANTYFKNANNPNKRRGTYIDSFKGLGDGNREISFSLTDIEKTTDFGSSGPGVNTNRSEVLQAIFISMSRDNPTWALNIADSEELFVEYLKQQGNNIGNKVKTHLDITEDMMDGLDNDWKFTFCQLPEDVNFFLSRDRSYILYHNRYNQSDCPYRMIKEKVKSLLPDIDISKFYPGDIVALSNRTLQGGNNGGSEYIRRLLNGINNINSLVLTLNRLFDAKILCSLSLKKLRQGSQYDVIINNEINDVGVVPNIKFEFYGFTVSDSMSGTGTRLDTETFYQGSRKIRCMSFHNPTPNSKANICGDVQGTTSRHGKIALPIMNRIIRNSMTDFNVNIQGLYQVSDHTVLHRMETEEIEEEVNNLTTEVIEMNEQGHLYVDKTTRGRDIQGDKNRMISKLQSLQLTKQLIQLAVVNRNCFNSAMTDIYKHAMSIQVWKSAPGQPPFNTGNIPTPKYFRTV